MPALFVVSSFDTPVSVFSIVTLTSETTAPEGSVTVPRISPEFVFCANPTALRSAIKTTNSAVAPKSIDRDQFFIRDSLCGSTALSKDTPTLLVKTYYTQTTRCIRLTKWKCFSFYSLLIVTWYPRWSYHTHVTQCFFAGSV